MMKTCTTEWQCVGRLSGEDVHNRVAACGVAKAKSCATGRRKWSSEDLVECFQSLCSDEVSVTWLRHEKIGVPTDSE